MTIKFYPDLEQRSEAWFAAKCGVLSASNMFRVLSPAKMEPIGLKKTGEYDPPAYLYELAAQRVNQFIEPTFQSFDMARGEEEEILALSLYNEKVAPIQKMGFVTNDRWGFKLGCSPDGLVGEDGGVQCKSRCQKVQMETIVTHDLAEAMIQIQTELLVTERKWWDLVSYSNGMNMYVIRIYPDAKVQNAILGAAAIFHKSLDATIEIYNNRITRPDVRVIPVERRVEQEMQVTEE